MHGEIPANPPLDTGEGRCCSTFGARYLAACSLLTNHYSPLAACGSPLLAPTAIPYTVSYREYSAHHW